MIRPVSICGFATLFLLISPALRSWVLTGITSLETNMDSYAPYSWIGAGLLVLCGLVVSLYRGAQPQ